MLNEFDKQANAQLVIGGRCGRLRICYKFFCISEQRFNLFPRLFQVAVKKAQYDLILIGNFSILSSNISKAVAHAWKNPGHFHAIFF